MKNRISIYDIAKKLRQRMTPAEKALWEKLRNNQLGPKIRRQEPFIFGAYRYVADFYCPALKLVIEIDGDVHNDIEVKEIDEFREDIFEQTGYKVVRFSNTEVENNINNVIERIKNFLVK